MVMRGMDVPCRGDIPGAVGAPAEQVWWWLCFPTPPWPWWPWEPPQPRAVVAFQEYLEDTLHMSHGAKSSPERCRAAPGSCTFHPTQCWDYPGVGGQGCRDPRLAWQLGVEPIPAKRLRGSSGPGCEAFGNGAGKGPSTPPRLQGGGSVFTLSPTQNVWLVAVGGPGGDVCLSFPSLLFWSLSWGNQPQDLALVIALSHSPGVRDSQQ